MSSSPQLAVDERSRIARDLREDLGARLLNQLTRAGDTATATEARVMLAELRSLLDVLDPRCFLLSDCIAEWQAALAECCVEAGLRLNWSTPKRWPARNLTPVQRCNPQLILREFVRNAARHSQPTYIEAHLRVSSQSLAISCRHDGLSRAPQAWPAARGLRMIDLRTQDLGGTLRWSLPQAEVAQLDLRLPLAYASAHA